MKWQLKLCAVFVAGIAGLATPRAHAQLAGKYLAPRDQVVAIRAGRLFDARSGMMLTNQVVLVRMIRGHFTADHHFAFEGAAWYWHFVDVVWLGLYVVVYWL